jgi:hypothetical protein
MLDLQSGGSVISLAGGFNCEQTLPLVNHKNDGCGGVVGQHVETE